MTVVPGKRFRDEHRWAFLGIVLLMVVGVITGLWSVKGEVSALSNQITLLPWGWWRGGVYCLLLLSWPWLLNLLVTNRKAQIVFKRRSLIFIIFFYEVIIVLNPLAIIIHWVSK